MRAGSRYGRLIVALVLTASSGTVGSAGQGGAPTQQPAAAAQPMFVGKVAGQDSSDLRGVRLRYEAGAYSNWHVHDGALVVLVEQGRGRMQLQGQAPQDLIPGQPVVMPAGVPHWHGAAPDQAMTWIALAVGRDVKWIGPLSEQEYRGKK